jgi:protein-tyrosine-phosphatase
MGVRSWLKGLRRRKDAVAVKSAEDQLDQTADERTVTSGDIEGMKLDAGAARSIHEGSVEDADRSGDR